MLRSIDSLDKITGVNGGPITPRSREWFQMMMIAYFALQISLTMGL